MINNNNFGEKKLIIFEFAYFGVLNKTTWPSYLKQGCTIRDVNCVLCEGGNLLFLSAAEKPLLELQGTGSHHVTEMSAVSKCPS